MTAEGDGTGTDLVDGVDPSLECSRLNHVGQLILDALTRPAEGLVHSVHADAGERNQILDDALAADLGVDGRDVLLEVDVEEIIWAVRLLSLIHI